jgi:hypothetical protein
MRIYEIAPGKKVGFNPEGDDLDAMYALASKHNNPILKYAKMIERDCSDALSAMRTTHLPLWRGFNSPLGDIFKGRTRDKRITYTTQAVVETFNEELARAGIEANRSNSMSCTAKAIDANSFGDLYYIFPLNGFNFSWSSKIEDFGSVFGHYDTAFGVMEAFNLDEDDSWVEAFDYKGYDFMSALRSGHEISINGEYYAFKAETPIFGQENQITLAQYLKIK